MVLETGMRRKIDGKFSCKSLSEALSFATSSKDPLYSIIWAGHSPKKVNFFMWELSYNSINTYDKLQHRTPWMSLSPNCCTICLRNSKIAPHIFNHCLFANIFWEFITESFNWSAPRPHDIHDLLSFYLVGHPFRNEKKTLWECFIRAFLWNLWLERNARIFKEKSQSIQSFLEHTTFTALTWCKLSSPFCNYNLNTLMYQWRCFL